MTSTTKPIPLGISPYALGAWSSTFSSHFSYSSQLPAGISMRCLFCLNQTISING